MDKQYRTRDGRAVEVLRVDMNHKHFPVAVIVTNSDGNQTVRSRTSNGRTLSSRLSGSDLIEVKPRIKQDVWLNFYQGKRPCVHLTRKEADNNASSNRLACIKVPIDCEHGEGL